MQIFWGKIQELIAGKKQNEDFLPVDFKEPIVLTGY